RSFPENAKFLPSRRSDRVGRRRRPRSVPSLLLGSKAQRGRPAAPPSAVPQRQSIWARAGQEIVSPGIQMAGKNGELGNEIAQKRCGRGREIPARCDKRARCLLSRRLRQGRRPDRTSTARCRMESPHKDLGGRAESGLASDDAQAKPFASIDSRTRFSRENAPPTRS